MALRFTEEQFLALQGKSKETHGDKKKLVISGGYRSHVQGWRTIGDKEKTYYRSLWDINTSRYFAWQKSKGWVKDWEYEPKKFKFDKNLYDAGPYQYVPDFRITDNDGNQYWVEVKGWLNPKSKAKLKRFAREFPEERLELWDKTVMDNLRKNFSHLVPDWERLPPKGSQGSDLDETPPESDK